MDLDVFNLGVRWIACDEAAVLLELKCYLLDLKFSICYLICYYYYFYITNIVYNINVS
jgi:hypothetical protein